MNPIVDLCHVSAKVNLNLNYRIGTGSDPKVGYRFYNAANPMLKEVSGTFKIELVDAAFYTHF